MDRLKVLIATIDPKILRSGVIKTIVAIRIMMIRRQDG